MVVIGAGTCGTLIGIAEKVKERCPECIVVGVDPCGSILDDPKNRKPHDYEVSRISILYYSLLIKNLYV